jgi:hypothetical protein
VDSGITTSLTCSFYGKTTIRGAPDWWRNSCSNVECTLHQLAPYIGKIKSSIAGDLIERYTKPGDLVVDPFAGAGTIPLEAAIRGRRAFAADRSPYARILSQAKLFPPRTLEMARDRAEAALIEAEGLQQPDMGLVPQWVRRFFHPKTLCETLRFAMVARRSGNEFLMASFLGILHHQRPGFLSHPSSHLVPYLRTKKYPRAKFPELYRYRELKPRLLSKINRTYRRFLNPLRGKARIYQSAIENLEFPERFDAVITSPPYMNALDYGRDNRLRLWFIDPSLEATVQKDITQRRKAFVDAITTLVTKVEKGLTLRHYCILVVGEEVQRSFSAHPAEVVVNIINQQTPLLSLRKVFTDSIPDIRRSRRELRGVKTEHFLVFKRG